MIKKDIYKVFIISLIYFLPKWLLSFYFFEEDILNKIIFEIDGDGSYFLPLMKYLSEMNLTNSFDSQVLELKNIPIPFGSLFIHSFLYLIIGNYSILIIEFFAVYFFILLLSKIIGFFLPKTSGVPIAIFFLIIPLLLQILSLNEVPFIKVLVNNFFSFRIHRPMMTTLYLLLFLFIMMNIKQNGWNNKNSFFLGTTLGLTFSSFYYYFIIQGITIFFYITNLYKFNYLQFIKNNKKNILILSSAFIFFAIPFIINIHFHEEDFTERMGVFVMNSDKKYKLIEYYIANILDYKFLIFVLCSLLLFVFVKKKDLEIYKYLYFFLIIFISSIISPLIFVSISNKSGLLYHFNNTIIMFGLIYFIISFFCIIFIFYKFFFLKYLSKIIYFIFFITLTFSFSQKYNNLNFDHDYRSKRMEINKITKIISNNSKKINEISILTFDNHFMIWGIMKNIKNLTVINAVFSPKKHSMIEDDLIDSFKFLKLDENHFLNFLQNEKKGWRYRNDNVRDFFLMRYQANKLNTYNNSKNFKPEVLKFINNSSPALHQQLAIPTEELIRLKEKFIKRKNDNFINPNLIILPKGNFIFNHMNNKLLDYCNVYDGKFYVYYSNIEENCNKN